MLVRLVALALIAVPLAGCEDPLGSATGGGTEVEAATGLASVEAEEAIDPEVEAELIGVDVESGLSAGGAEVETGGSDVEEELIGAEVGSGF